MMQMTRKLIKKIHASYTLEGTDLENVETIKYLGSNNYKWFEMEYTCKQCLH